MEINLNEIAILIIIVFAIIELISFIFRVLYLHIKYNLDKKLKITKEELKKLKGEE